MRVSELRPGFWRWTALHPDWTPEEGGPDGWEQEVGCLYYEAPDAVVLVDPLAPADGTPDAGRFWSALDRDVEAAARLVAVVLTVFWHERSAASVVDRYGASLWADGRRTERLSRPPTNTFLPGDELPGGIRAFDAGGRNECLFWIERHRALVAGDILLGDPTRGVRICPESWLHPRTTHEDVRRALRLLLELPVELLLVAHGEPVLENARAALERALA